MTFDPEPPSNFRKKLIVWSIVVAAVAGLAGGGIAWWMLRPKPFGMESRVPWTVSKVVGSPEKPDPYTVEPLFPNLKLSKPVDVAFLPGSRRVVVAGQEGQIVSFPNDRATSSADPMLDLTQAVGVKKIPGYRGIEVHSLAFDPHFRENHRLFVCYRIVLPARHTRDDSRSKTATRLSRFTVKNTDPPTIDPASENVFLTWPGGGNIGGCIRFGNDANLYISTGDGADSAAPDPDEAAQDVSDLRGKILRIDVAHSQVDLPYSIPADNPFRDLRSAAPEVFAYGLHNPRRISIDSRSGELWSADEGWSLWDTIEHVVNGANYGWSIREGPQPIYPSRKPGPTPIVPPELSLPHDQISSITGGIVYHGKNLPELDDQYLFADRESGRIWAAPCDGVKLGKYHALARTDLHIEAFGEDGDGELYLLDSQMGGIWRIVKNSVPAVEPDFPRQLSQTGLFADVAAQQPSTGVIPFSINAPQWLDGSSSQRFIAVPSAEAIVDDKDKGRIFPANTVLVRTLSLAMVAGNPGTRRKIETQLLHFDGRRWHDYSYRWNETQTDAALVDAGGADAVFTIADPAAPAARRAQTWHFASRAQCTTCHNPSTRFALAFTEPQLDRVEQYQVPQRGLVADNQLRSFRHIGLMPPEQQAEKPSESSSTAPPSAVLVNPYEEDPAHSLDERARSYLDVNCSTCHRVGGSGSALIDLRKELTLRETRVVAGTMLGNFDLPDAQIISPGDPTRSVLYFRMAKSSAGRMPYLGTNLVDDPGLALIAKWIASLHGTAGAAPLSEETRHEQGIQGAALQTLQTGAAGNAAIAPLDKLLATPDGALRLLIAVQDGRISAALRPLAIERSLYSPSAESVRELFSRFVADGNALRPRIGVTPNADKTAKLLAMAGDPSRGKRVFFETAGGLCSRCHTVGSEGTQFGPDLTHIAAKHRKAEILESILNPSKTITPGFETWQVKTRTGEIYLGFIELKSESETVLKDADRKVVHLSNSKIETMVMQAKSAMPDGLIADLELQQAADLLEFLMTCK